MSSILTTKPDMSLSGKDSLKRRDVEMALSVKLVREDRGETRLPAGLNDQHGELREPAGGKPLGKT